MRMFIRDTASEFPTATTALGGLFEGDLAVALDTDRVSYWDGSAWVLTTAGSASITVEEVDGAPSVAATKIKFAQADGLTVTDEGGGVARINNTAGSAPNLRRYSYMFGG